MTGDRDVAAPHQLYFGLSHVNRMTINDIALYQAGLSPTRLLTMKATSLGRQFDPGADSGA